MAPASPRRLNSGIEELLLQQPRGDPEHQRQQQRQHDHRRQENLEDGLSRQPDIVGDLADDELGRNRVTVVGRGRGRLAAIAGEVSPVGRNHLLAMVLGDAIRQRRIELLVGVQQGPGAGGVDQVDVDVLEIGMRVHRIGEEILEEELAHPGEVAVGDAGADVGRHLDDVVFALGAEVAVGPERARDLGQVDAVVHDLAGPEHRIEEHPELALGKDQIHVGGQVGLEHRVGAVDEVDVLDAMLLGERIELVDGKIGRLAAEALELLGDLRQHLCHVGRDPLVLAAQHVLEDGEAVGEAGLDLVDLVVLQSGDQPVHRQRGDDGRAEADRDHHGKKEQPGLALHR